jgi:hypothetical protein
MPSSLPKLKGVKAVNTNPVCTPVLLTFLPWTSFYVSTVEETRTNFADAKSLQPQDIKRAAAEIMSQNTFGGVCGAVCSDEWCMSACVRKDVDRPVDIPAVQASIVERAHRMGLFPKWTRRLFYFAGSVFVSINLTAVIILLLPDFI